MGMDFSTLVYAPAFDMFSRYATITPVASQGQGAAAYQVRVIWHSDQIQVPLEDGSFLQDQNTYVDIRQAEVGTVPAQNDLITIPADGSVPAEGDFQITNVHHNGGGEISLQLQKIVS
jgi:hypothetical protein